MKKYFLLISLIFSACSSNPPIIDHENDQLSDNLIQKDIVGRWQKSETSFKTFYKDYNVCFVKSLKHLPIATCKDCTIEMNDELNEENRNYYIKTCLMSKNYKLENYY